MIKIYERTKKKWFHEFQIFNPFLTSTVRQFAEHKRPCILTAEMQRRKEKSPRLSALAVENVAVAYCCKVLKIKT